MAAFCFGCQNAPRHYAAEPYYQHRYPAARDAVRPHAMDRRSENVVLDNLRLGMASLADGDLDESERALLRAYEYLISGGVNEPDRVIASTVVHEGTRVWKGEPFEQAMAFYYIATLYMVRGDWENARAAASNSLFALRDFQAADMRQVAERANRDEQTGRGDYLESGWRKVESEFTLGYLLVAANYVLMGQPEDAARMFEHVRELRPDLKGLADALEANDYDTLLLVDSGRGPRKQAYGPDESLIRFVPDGRFVEPLSLHLAIGDTALASGLQPVVDLWTLSQYPRWWSLEGMRKAKSAIGNVLLVGGLGAATIGSHARSEEALYAGLGAAVAGLALKASASADVRHLEMLPRGVFLVPMKLGDQPRDLTVHVAGAGGARGTWHDLRGGAAGKPQVYYLRMHDGGGGGMPQWASHRLYSIIAEQYQPGDRPWVMGGRDLTPPGSEILNAYHSAGVLGRTGVQELVDGYRGEGLLFQPGPQGMSGEEAMDPALYRHVIEGGRTFWQPRPGTHLYQRLTRTEHRPYAPRSEALLSIIARSETIAQPVTPANVPPGVISRPIGTTAQQRSVP